MSDNNSLNVLLIGIDAACPPVFERLYEDNVIPTLQSICEDGISGPLQSQIPPWTPSAWPSMYTGMNPGKHGIFGFVGFDGYDYHVVAGSDVQQPRIWTILDQHDLSSVIVNVPVTHPPDSIDGAIIPGFIGPEHPPCHPDGILEDVRNAIGDYRVYPNYARGDQQYSDAEKMDEYCRLVSMRGRAFRYLENRFDPDFGFIEFQKTDTVFHEFDGEWTKVKQVYAETDRQIKKILEQANPELVFIASDHGMGRYERDEFRVNSFLRDEGYVQTKRGGKGMPTWNTMRSDLREGDHARTKEQTPIETVTATLAQVGLTPRHVGRVLERIGIADLVKQYIPAGVVRAGEEQVNFPSSIAYMRARTELGVRINLQGREPSGVVDPDSYETVRRELIDLLSSITASDGTPVFETVAPREEFFHGPAIEQAVDIVTIPTDFQHFLSAAIRDEHFGPPTEPWNHKLDGLFAAKGEEIDTDASIENVHLFDIAPTILAAMDIHPNQDMDGTVIPVVSPLTPVEYPDYTDNTQLRVGESIENRLTDLGYME